ncbi:hypothetical protein ACI2TD_17880 [Ralstonia nicotianae]
MEHPSKEEAYEGKYLHVEQQNQILGGKAERTRAGEQHGDAGPSGGRIRGQVGLSARVDLLKSWKAERMAFGALIVAYAFLMSVASLMAKFPDGVNHMTCAVLRALVGWRLWLLFLGSGCLIASLLIAIDGHHATATEVAGRQPDRSGGCENKF